MCLAAGVRPCEWRITQWEDQISVRQRYFLQAILPHQFPLEDARKVNLLSLLNYRPRIIGKNQKEEYKTNATVLLQTVIENFVSLKCLARCSSFLSSYQGSARCKDLTVSRPEHRLTDKAKFVPQLSAFSPPLHCTGLGNLRKLHTRQKVTRFLPSYALTWISIIFTVSPASSVCNTYASLRLSRSSKEH